MPNIPLKTQHKKPATNAALNVGQKLILATENNKKLHADNKALRDSALLAKIKWQTSYMELSKTVTDLMKNLEIKDIEMANLKSKLEKVNQTNQHLSNELNKANETNQQLDRQLADANTQINQLKSDQAALKIHLPPNNSSTPNSKEHQTDERTKELQHELASSRKSVHELKNKFASYLKQ